MTTQERLDLKIALDFMKEWREDDRKWKESADESFADLQTRVTTIETRDRVEDEVAKQEDVKQQKAEERWYQNMNLLSGLAGGVGFAVLQFLMQFFSKPPTPTQ